MLETRSCDVLCEFFSRAVVALLRLRLVIRSWCQCIRYISTPKSNLPSVQDALIFTVLFLSNYPYKSMVLGLANSTNRSLITYK